MPKPHEVEIVILGREQADPDPCELERTDVVVFVSALNEEYNIHFCDGKSPFTSDHLQVPPKGRKIAGTPEGRKNEHFRYHVIPASEEANWVDTDLEAADPDLLIKG